MNNKVQNNTLDRMKSLMNYGLTNESKANPYSAIEYQKLGADGKMYGIVREGTKYYIKVADNKPNLVTEDYNYIGGFRNRGENAYEGFAKAQKDFELKMMAIKESVDNRDYKVETWDFDKKENVVVEGTEKMRKEILRERQIMSNVNSIVENKAVECPGAPFCVKAPEEQAATQKPNMNKGEEHKQGDAKKAVEGKKANLKNTDLKESEEVLGWHDSNGDPKNDHYMDKSHGTEIGDGAPFDVEPNTNNDEMENGVVEEGEVMHTSQNQNSPEVGTSERGDDAPFDDEKGKQIDEAIDDMEIDDEEVEGGDDEGFEDDMDVDVDGEGDVDVDVEDDGLGDDVEIDDEIDDEPEEEDGIDNVYADNIEGRLNSLEDLMGKIAAALGVDDEVDAENYEDDDLFDDEEEDFDDDEDFEDDDFEDEEDIDIQEEGRKGVRIIESRGFKKAMRRINEENRLNDFGKHPAYQKKVMTYPTPNQEEMPDYYDMNDDSVKSEKPYGLKIGSSAPFEITPEEIANSIAESIIRLKKKSQRPMRGRRA